MTQKRFVITAFFLIIILILSVTLAAIIISNRQNDTTRDGFTEDYLGDTIPANFHQGQTPADPTPLINTSSPRMVYEVVISWIFEKNAVYTHYGGTLRASIGNNGTLPLYIYKIGIKPTWPVKGNQRFPLDEYISVDTGVYVNTTNKEYVGMLYFPGPESSGNYEYNILFWAYQQNADGTWNDCGKQVSTSRQIDVIDFETASSYKRHYNLPHYFDKINSVVDPTSDRVINLSHKLAGEFSGPFNIYQVGAIFDYIYENIIYVSDPASSENYWCTPEQTLDIGGDCEDFSTLMASLLISIGGAVRMYLTDSHAFVALYIGNDSSVDPILEALQDYYNSNIPLFWFSDELGNWLILDAIGTFYAGGLPLGAAPVVNTDDNGSGSGSEWTWDFTETKNLYVVDIKP
jgi:transglutaminase-like putative cysteine protease